MFFGFYNTKHSTNLRNFSSVALSDFLGVYFPQRHVSTKIALDCVLLSAGEKVHSQWVICHSLFPFYAVTRRYLSGGC